MRILKFAGLAVLVLVVLVSVAVFVYLKTRIPAISGTLKTKEVTSEVKIIRDAYGVPHIEAVKSADLYFALGYVQAQDRLFQMDFYRRAARGELSEILGKDLLDADKYLRTMGFLRTARAQGPLLSPATRALVESYSRGINYFLEHGPMPVEFTLLGYKPRPWSPEDSLAIGNLLAFQLASWAYQNEITQYLVLNKLGQAKAQEFLPVYPENFVPIIAAGGERGGRKERMSAASAEFLDTYVRRVIASNNWVVSGKRTATGKPLLGDDSHEEGPELPTQWHMAHLSGPGIDTAGAMFPGTPLFVWGHNRRVAWGLTNFTLDNQDLYLEKINPADPRQVMYRGGWVDIRILKEKIPVKGDKGVEVVEYEVRLTPHGPIINDIEKDLGAAPVSMRRVEAETRSIAEALYGIALAGGWKDFKKALSLYSAGPQHFVYADVDGNIGYIGAGKCPVRRNSDGLLPSPGWDGTREWEGYYPFEMMPQAYNPAAGFIATANNRPLRGKLPIPLSEYWECPYRAERITDLIQSKKLLTVDDFKTMHTDDVSILAGKLVPLFVKLLGEKSDPALAPYVKALGAWNHRVDDESAGTCIYEVMLNRLPYEVFHDELGDDLYKRYIKDKIGMTNTLVDLLTRRTGSVLFDDAGTPGKETRADAVKDALAYAVGYLRKELGDDMAGWKWSSLHQIEFAHVFGQEPMLRPFFNYGPFPFPGDEHTINRAGYANDNPFKVNITASIRYIVDFSNISKSLIVLSTGQSAHLLSRHRTDMSDLFMKGEYIPWHYAREDYTADSEGTIVLAPE